jgi:hypothetical protein
MSKYDGDMKAVSKRLEHERRKVQVKTQKNAGRIGTCRLRRLKRRNMQAAQVKTQDKQDKQDA